MNATNIATMIAPSDSMSPTFEAGDILEIDTNIKSIGRDGIYIFSVNGFTFIRRITHMDGGKLQVSSDNPAIRKTETITKEQISVYGQVIRVWNGRRM